jgi:hypothetical protein
MSKEEIATIKNMSMGSLCDPREQEQILNDLWDEWVKLALELEPENAVRRRFPELSDGPYGRLERWVDGLTLLRWEVWFHSETLRRAIVSWFAVMAFTNRWNLPRQPRHWFNTKPTGESYALGGSPGHPLLPKRIGGLARVIHAHFAKSRASNI